MSPQKITIASMVTLSRFFLIPIFVGLFLEENYRAALIVFLVAGFTDFLDGFLARRFNMRSRLGSMLDPLADKFLMLCSFVLLSWLDYVPRPLAILVIGRDFFIMLGTGILMSLKIRLFFKPTRLSKITTASQIIILAFGFLRVLIDKKPFLPYFKMDEAIELMFPVLVLITALLTIITFFQYTYIAYKFYRYGERQS